MNYVESLVNQGKVAAEQLACPLPECRSPVPTDVLQAQCLDSGSFNDGFDRFA